MRGDLVGLVGFGVALRLGLLLLFPVPYGDDSFGRLFFRDSIFLSHWLPLTQAVVFAVSGLGGGIFAVRFCFALIGGLAPAGFYLFLRRLFGRRVALAGGVLFSVNGLYVVLSLMPYQGPLFLGLFYASLALLLERPRLASPAGSLLFGLSALTRYEAWFTAPLLAAWKAWSDRRRAGGAAAAAVRSLLWFGWAPLLWLAASRLHFGQFGGFLFQGPGGSFYGWHPHFDLAWAAGYAGRMLWWAIGFGSPLVLLAPWGVWRLSRRPGGVPGAVRLLLGAGLLVLLFFFFVIGRQQETVFRFVLFPLSILLVAAAAGLEGIWERLARWRPAALRLLLTGSILLLAAGAAYRVRQLDAASEYRTPYRLARYLEAVLPPGETVLVVAQRSARLEDAAPMGYQRLVVASRLDRSRWLTSGLLLQGGPRDWLEWARGRRVRYLVVYERFEPRLASDRFFLDLRLRHPALFRPVFETGGAAVYRVSSWPESPP